MIHKGKPGSAGPPVDLLVGGAQGEVAGGACSLVELVRALPATELMQLIERVEIHVDPAKRIDVPLQVARALVNLPEVRDTNLMAHVMRETLYRVMEAQGTLRVAELSSAATGLMNRGILFVRGGVAGEIRLVLPSAMLLQIKGWEGEDPRGFRALLGQISDEVKAAVASYYLGRPATLPLSLALESAWQVFSDAERLKLELARLSTAERKLLSEIDELGGEVDTEELLHLEREPLRLRNASGPAPARRGVGYALERRGFLVPLHPNRHLIPLEVSRIVGAERRNERTAARRAIFRFVLGEDHAPRRAQFSENPAWLALALALAARESGLDLKPAVAVPRSLIARWAARFGQEADGVALIAALSRAIGLWDLGASNEAVPPGCYQVSDLPERLFDAWYRGGVWNEAQPAGDLWRRAPGARDGSAVSTLRTVLLDALRELGDGRWIPWEAIAGYLRTDERAVGIGRLIERWAARASVPSQPLAEIARRMTLESLHTLGVVDLGSGDDDDPDAEIGTTLRVTPRGRALLRRSLQRSAGDQAGSHAVPGRQPSEYGANATLRVGDDAKVAHVLSLSPFVEVRAVAQRLDLAVTATTLMGAVAQGLEVAQVEQQLAKLAALPDSVQRWVAQAGSVLGSAEFVACQGVLKFADPVLRDLLSSKRQTADLFLDSSPAGLLLISPTVDFDQVVRRCRMLGIEVTRDGRVCRTRSTIPPPLQSGVPPARSGLPPIGQLAAVGKGHSRGRASRR